MASPHVDYEQVAPEYAKRRTPTEDRLAIWGTAVAGSVSNADLAVDAEAIPLRDNAADLIWISTAFHHFTDPHTSAGECRRVLSCSGHLVIRGFVPGHTELAWLDLLPSPSDLQFRGCAARLVRHSLG